MWHAKCSTSLALYHKGTRPPGNPSCRIKVDIYQRLSQAAGGADMRVTTGFQELGVPNRGSRAHQMV